MTFEQFKSNALTLAKLRYLYPSVQTYTQFIDGYSATFYENTKGDRLAISYNCVSEQFNLHYLHVEESNQ